jgi:hypothetical protein
MIDGDDTGHLLRNRGIDALDRSARGRSGAGPRINEAREVVVGRIHGLARGLQRAGAYAIDRRGFDRDVETFSHRGESLKSLGGLFVRGCSPLFAGPP